MMSTSSECQQTHSKDEVIMLFIFVDSDYGIPHGFEIDVLSSTWRSVDFGTKMNIKQVIVIIHTNAGQLHPFPCVVIFHLVCMYNIGSSDQDNGLLSI